MLRNRLPVAFNFLKYHLCVYSMKEKEKIHHSWHFSRINIGQNENTHYIVELVLILFSFQRTRRLRVKRKVWLPL
jgi:hypothetical protein